MKLCSIHSIGSQEGFGVLRGGITRTRGMHVSDYHSVRDSRDDLVPSIVTAKILDFLEGNLMLSTSRLSGTTGKCLA